MPKIKIEDLKRIQEDVRSSTALKEGGWRAKINIHTGTCGIAAGAKPVYEAVKKAVAEKELKDVMVITTGCAGFCSREPMATVEILGQPPVKYIKLDEKKIMEILESHVIGGNVVKEYAIAMGSEMAI